MEKKYKYSVISVYDAGLIRVGYTMTQHNSKAAAFRSMHHLKNIHPKDRDFYVEDNETGEYVIESWTYRNGRKVYL